MANSLTATLALVYGDTAVANNVAGRQNFSFTLAYAEESTKIVHVPPSTTDHSIALDSVTAPKFLFARTLDTDVTCKLVSGLTNAPTTLTAAGGWVMLCTPAGQPVNELLITTPASPAGGAHVQILAFE